jgi:carboxypeptidase T
LSEPETMTISKFLFSKPSIKAGIDFHAYSQLNLRPWGKVSAPSPDEAKLAKIGQDMMDALRRVHNISYRNIRSAQLYPAAGILCDEFYETHKFPGYTIELRPSSQWGGGFNPPANQILPCAEENYQAVLSLAEFVKNS